jgi:hypothetical protein
VLTKHSSDNASLAASTQRVVVLADTLASTGVRAASHARAIDHWRVAAVYNESHAAVVSCSFNTVDVQLFDDVPAFKHMCTYNQRAATASVSGHLHKGDAEVCIVSCTLTVTPLVMT